MESKYSRVLGYLAKSEPVLLTGRGGLGKTSFCLSLYRYLLENQVKEESGKRMVPVYVPCGVLSEKNGEFAIRSYLFEKYLSQLEESEEIWKNNLQTQLLEKEGLSYQFVLILDAVNEFYHADNILAKEILILCGCRNVSVLATSRVEHDFLASFHVLSLKPLSDEVIVKNLEKLGIKQEEELKELLKIPFYLSKFLELHQNSALSEVTEAYGLLEAYKEFSVDKYANANGAIALNVKEGTMYLKEVIKDTVDKLLPKLAFEACIKRKIVLSEELDSVRERILVPMGFLVKNGERCRFSHEITRDFFASNYLKRKLEYPKENEEELIRILSSNDIPEDVLRFTVDGLGKEKARECLDELNHLIQTKIDVEKTIWSIYMDKNAKENQQLNRSLVEMYGYISPVLDGINMSHRDLRTVNFAHFYKVTNCDFTGSYFRKSCFPGLCEMTRPVYIPLPYKEYDKAILKNCVLFLDRGCLIYVDHVVLHKLYLKDGADSLFGGVMGIIGNGIDEIEKYDEDTLWVKEKEENGRIPKEWIVRVKDGLYQDITGKEKYIKTEQKKSNVRKYFHEDMVVYEEGFRKGSKKKLLRMKEKIIDVLCADEKLLLVETETMLYCYRLEKEYLKQAWKFSKKPMQMRPMVLDGERYFFIMKADGTNSIAKIKDSKLELIKPFDATIPEKFRDLEDVSYSKEPILNKSLGIETHLSFISVAMKYEEYVVDENGVRETIARYVPFDLELTGSDFSWVFMEGVLIGESEGYPPGEYFLVSEEAEIFVQYGAIIE